MDGIGLIGNYCKILDDKKYVYILRNEDTIVDDDSFYNWYKVVEVE